MMNMTWGVALTLLIGCRTTPEPRTPDSDRRVTFDFKDIPLADALNRLQAMSGVKILVDPLVVEHVHASQVTLALTDVPLGVALDLVLATCPSYLKSVQGSDGWIVTTCRLPKNKDG